MSSDSTPYNENSWAWLHDYYDILNWEMARHSPTLFEFARAVSGEDEVAKRVRHLHRMGRMPNKIAKAKRRMAAGREKRGGRVFANPQAQAFHYKMAAIRRSA